MTKEDRTWLERIVKRVMTAEDGEIESMAFVVKTKRGIVERVETNYSRHAMADKILFAGVMQMDATRQSIEEDEEIEMEDKL